MSHIQKAKPAFNQDGNLNIMRDFHFVLLMQRHIVFCKLRLKFFYVHIRIIGVNVSI